MPDNVAFSPSHFFLNKYLLQARHIFIFNIVSASNSLYHSLLFH